MKYIRQVIELTFLNKLERKLTPANKFYIDRAVITIFSNLLGVDQIFKYKDLVTKTIKVMQIYIICLYLLEGV